MEDEFPDSWEDGLVHNQGGAGACSNTNVKEAPAVRLDRTSDYGAFQVAHSESPCPESPDQLEWIDFELYLIDAPFAVATPTSGYLLARYSRWAVECFTAGAYGNVDLCAE